MNQSLHQYMINRNVLTTELMLTAVVMAASRQSAQHVFISWVQAQKINLCGPNLAGNCDYDRS